MDSIDLNEVVAAVLFAAGALVAFVVAFSRTSEHSAIPTYASDGRPSTRAGSRSILGLSEGLVSIEHGNRARRVRTREGRSVSASNPNTTARTACSSSRRSGARRRRDYFPHRLTQSREPSHFLEHVGAVERKHDRKVLIRPGK
jgi:hypothetical protein